MRRFFKFSMALFLALTAASCIREQYDFNRDLDLTIGFGGDSLAMPIGQTGRLTLDSLLADSSIFGSIKTEEDGTYVLDIEPSTFEESMNVIAEDAFNIDEVSKTEEFPVEMKVSEASKAPGQGNPREAAFGAKAGTVTMRADIQQDVDLSFNFEGIPEEIIEVDHVVFSKKTHMKVLISFKDYPSGLDWNKISPNLTVTFPTIFTFDDPAVRQDNSAFLNEFTQDGVIEMDYNLKSIDFSQEAIVDREIHFVRTVDLSGYFLWEQESGGGEPETVQMKAEVVCSVVDIDAEQIKGRFDMEMDKVDFSFSFENTPEILTSDNVDLAFENPAIALDIITNTGMPINAVLNMMPVNGGIPDESVAQQVNLRIEAGEPDVERHIYYWLAKNTDYMPQGYEFVQADIGPMLRRLPDEFSIVLNAAVDSTLFVEYVFGHQVDVKGDVTTRIPLIFGKDLQIDYGTDFANAGDLTNYLKDNEIQLLLDVENGFPLDFSVRVSLLDQNNDSIPMPVTGAQKINSCMGDGTSVLSSVVFALSGKDGVLEGKTVSAVHLDFNIGSNEAVAGRAVTDDNYIQAKVKARIPGGLNINLKDLQK